MTRREFIKSHEGLRLRKYRCSRGHWTIGWGWNLDAHPLPADIASYYRIHGAITEEIAERLLDISMAAVEADCRDIYPGFDQFTDRRKDALVDFVFNLGAAGALKFRKMRAAIIAGDWLEAARQLNDSAYWRQLGGDPAGTDDGKVERPEELYRMLVEG